MESLAETPWDVVISGTGLGQSLLALALSRSDKKIIHVDKNPYYGGAEAAVSLQEAQEWVDNVNKEPGKTPFEKAEIYAPPDAPETGTKLSSSRAYTLSLSPHMIYSRSRVLPALLSSKVYRQLEFQAVGSWWISKAKSPSDGTDGDSSLYRVPSSREDVFADDLISVKSKRTLMKFLRHIGKPRQDDESQTEQDDMSVAFPDYLSSKFQVPAELHDPLLSLSLSQTSPQQTSAEFAVSRIQRHLASVGVFGPGFGSLLAKYGSSSELAQVGCRALAVGGGVYVLNSGIESITNSADSNSEGTRMELKLSSGESIRAKTVVGSHWDLPDQTLVTQPSCDRAVRSINIISSPLDSLFPVTAEGGPIPAGAVVVFPASILGQPVDSPPVYLMVHSSETGECPPGQSVVYGSASCTGTEGYSLLETAVHKLLESVVEQDAKVLWSMRYTQLGRLGGVAEPAQALRANSPSGDVICFPPPSLDHAFDDTLLDVVREAWKTVTKGAVDEDFMTFDDREREEDL